MRLPTFYVLLFQTMTTYPSSKYNHRLVMMTHFKLHADAADKEEFNISLSVVKMGFIMRGRGIPRRQLWKFVLITKTLRIYMDFMVYFHL